MPTLPRTGLTYPTENQNPYFDIIERLFQAFDTIFYAHREDRNVLMTGGGSLAWNATSGALSWDEDIVLFSPHKAFSLTLPTSESPCTLSNGSVLYIDMTRAPGSNIVLTKHVSSVVPNNDNALLICYRSGDNLYFRNGLVIGDGYSGPMSPSVSYKSYDFVGISDVLDGSAPPAAAAVVTSGNGSVMARKFSGAASEDVRIAWKVPADIVASAGIKFKVVGYITEATAPSVEGVSFKLAGYSIGDDDPLNGTFGTEIESNETSMSHAQYDQFITVQSGTVTVTDLAAGEVAMLNFYRDHDDTDDTYVQDVGVVGIEIEWTRQPS